MTETLYNMIFRRRSFHQFPAAGAPLSAGDLDAIRAFWDALAPLCPDIRTAMRIVPAAQTTNQHGQEYCIALYSEQKDNYLLNIGYLGQMLDLWLVSRGIGTCWFGIGKPAETTYEGLPYVIMLAIGRVDDPGAFRQDLFAAKRKPLADTWQGALIDGVADIARFAPSACNSQPWRVKLKGETLQVFRHIQTERVGIMTPQHAAYFNRIDMGIYLCILSLCLRRQGCRFFLTLHPDTAADGQALTATLELHGAH